MGKKKRACIEETSSHATRIRSIGEQILSLIEEAEASFDIIREGDAPELEDSRAAQRVLLLASRDAATLAARFYAPITMRENANRLAEAMASGKPYTPPE